MAYSKTVWEERLGRDLNKFTKSHETAETVILENTPDEVTQEGTLFSADNMNKIEQGIYDAHAMAEAAENEIQRLNRLADGTAAIALTGSLLSRVINGSTQVPKSLFNQGTVFAAGKTLINDEHGTLGVYAGDFNPATLIIITKSTSPAGADETANLGVAASHADLPLTVAEAVSLWGRTPNINDYATVEADETQNGFRVEWYIVNIDENGNIEWGNPVIINTSDYQEQSTIGMAGKVLTGGAAAGTFGDAKSIDTEPAAGSNNLISSGAVKVAIGPLAANSQSVTIGSSENTNKFGTGAITQSIGTWFQQIGQKINGLISNIININTNITNINTSIAKIKRFTIKTDGIETIKTGITSFNYSGIMLVSVYGSYDNSNTIYFVIYKNGQYTKQTPLVGSTSNYGYSQISFSMQSDGINISIGDYPFNINILFLDGAV